MSSIQNSLVVEDKYIAYLAGMQTGKKIIESNDERKAYLAQKHPISNKITASIMGLINSSIFTTAGVLAYPLVNGSMRSSILGSRSNVCVTCGSNLQSIALLITDIQRKITPEKSLPNWAENCAATISSYVIGIDAATSCTTNEQALMSCRAFNLVGGTWNTLSDNYMLIGAIGVSLMALFTFSQMNTYVMQERQSEEDIKKSLTDRFGKIATRLISRETNQEVQEYAKNILQRQLEINKELEALQLPTLTWRGIEQITQPVFNAAKNITNKSKHAIV